MKKLLTGILIATLTTLMMAKEIDMTKAKGTEQSVIHSLTPPKAYMDTDQDVVLKAMFDVELDAKHVHKNNVKLKKITEKQQSMIDGEVVYDAIENAVIFTPSKILAHGYYEVEFKSLKAIKSKKEQQIKEIKYRFYVPEVINGFKLPLAPDKIVNNATLLGVDSNSNGVRDDVERYIVNTYGNEKIAVEIGFQVARAYNSVIEDPANAEETMKVLDAAQDCEGYFRVYAKLFKEDFYLEKAIMTKSFRSMNLNTEERIRGYLLYDKALSGGVYDSTKIKDMKSKCTFDVEQMLKDRK